MKIVYRISDTGYNKVKASYISNENCFRNFCNVFSENVSNILVIADNVCDDTTKMISKYVKESQIHHVKIGHGAGTFNIGFDLMLLENDSEVVYFVENDYVHRKGSEEVILEGLTLGADYVTLYDHLDKYFDGPNPYVYQGGEDTKVFLTKSCHWKLTNSTTMTFASTVKTLKEHQSIIKNFTKTSHPYDFDMWIALRNIGATLVSPIPGYSTHGDLPTIAPLINWENEIQC